VLGRRFAQKDQSAFALRCHHWVPGHRSPCLSQMMMHAAVALSVAKSPVNQSLFGTFCRLRRLLISTDLVESHGVSDNSRRISLLPVQRCPGHPEASEEASEEARAGGVEMHRFIGPTAHSPPNSWPGWVPSSGQRGPDARSERLLSIWLICLRLCVNVPCRQGQRRDGLYLLDELVHPGE
jgi:hypothetical protein